MTDAWTATEAAHAQALTRHTWHRLFHSLKKWIVVRGIDAEVDKRLEEMPIATEWWTDPAGKGGPEDDILTAFRENAELWLSACPADDVVVMPKEIFSRIIGALPPLTYTFPADAKLGDAAPGLPQMSADEWARIGRDQLIRYADMRRHQRERAEREGRPASADGLRASGGDKQ